MILGLLYFQNQACGQNHLSHSCQNLIQNHGRGAYQFNETLYIHFNISIYIKAKKDFMFWRGYMDGILINVRWENKKSFGPTKL
jgi:hypothetical protein